MKKIFILLALFLMFGLFVGCASKPKTSTNNKVSISTNPTKSTKPTFNPDLEYEKKLSEYIEMLYGPIDIQDVYSKLYRSYAFDARGYALAPDRRMIEPLVTDRKDYSGKITNATDKDVTFRLTARNPSTQKRVIGEFVIPANETYYVIIENAVLFGEYSVVMCDLNPESYVYCLALSADGERSNFLPHKTAFFDINNFSVMNELFKSHSFEFIYNHVCTEKYFKNYGRNYITKLVEPFEDKIRNEKNLIIIHQAENN